VQLLEIKQGSRKNAAEHWQKSGWLQRVFTVLVAVFLTFFLDLVLVIVKFTGGSSKRTRSNGLSFSVSALCGGCLQRLCVGCVLVVFQVLCCCCCCCNSSFWLSAIPIDELAIGKPQRRYYWRL
jgi:hypothetical protein